MSFRPPQVSAELGRTLDLTTTSAAQTAHIGAILAPLLAVGDVLPLWGGFGAGKTTFVQGVARGLGVTRAVVSPSFGLVNEYHGNGLTLYHLDLYRVGSVEEAEAFGVDEVLGGYGAALIEWPEVVRALLPDERLDITFEMLHEDLRLIRFAARGERGQALLAAYARVAGSR